MKNFEKFFISSYHPVLSVYKEKTSKYVKLVYQFHIFLKKNLKNIYNMLALPDDQKQKLLELPSYIDKDTPQESRTSKMLD